MSGSLKCKTPSTLMQKFLENPSSEEVIVMLQSKLAVDAKDDWVRLVYINPSFFYSYGSCLLVAVDKIS